MVATVKLSGKTVGAVLWDSQWDLATFEFDPSFVQSGLDIAPLGMPLGDLQRGKLIYSFPSLPKEGFYGLPGLLTDSLPGAFGTQLINIWLKGKGRDPATINPVQRLLFTGRRGTGALEFEPAQHPTDNKSDIVFIDGLAEMAEDALTSKAEFNTGQNESFYDILRVSTSTGGSRAKALLAINEHTGEVRSGQSDAPADFRHWIIKLDGVTNKLLNDPRGYGRIEYAYYLMARDCGIDMMESTLLEENNRAHFLTMRFDRIGGREKLHIQSLSAIGHIYSGDPLTATYEKAFEVMRQLRLPHTETEQLFGRMIFNIMARNQNDHVENTSFIMSETGKWRLAPAYDITYAYQPEKRYRHRMQMSVNGKYDQFTKKDIYTVASEIRVKRPDAIIEKIADHLSAWPEYARQAGIPAAQANVIKKMFRFF
ncbi:MAG: type II toxin-antitoxin system HipA family toxin [Crocinitomicaceae bacterium]|nr:type II toxin-antitoxin system HipA family toxin [Crocinitomicaceae bacterium]